MATHHNFRIKNGLEVGGILIVNSSGQLVVADINANQKFLDDVRLRFGNSSDYQIFHHNNGVTYLSGSTVEHNANTWRLMNLAGTEAIIKGNADGNVELFYDGGSRLVTTTAGVQIPSAGTTMGWSNLANAWLLLGTSSAGIGIDNNEIMAKGVGSLYLGTADSGANVIIRAGGTPARMTIAASDGEVTIPGDLSVGGDLNITGDINSVSVTDLDVVDKTITLGKGQTESNSGSSGIIVDGSLAELLWDEGDNQWEFNKNVYTTGFINAASGISEFATAKVNAGGLRVHGGGTYSDPGSQMYLHADGSGYGRLAVFDMSFLVGGNSARTVQALKLTSTGDVHLKDNAVLQFGNSSHSIQSGASHSGGDMTLTTSDDMWFRTRWARFQDIVGSAGEYARISYNGSWIYSNLITRNHTPQTDSTYYLGASGNEWAGAYIDTGYFGSLDVSGNVDIDGTLETDGLTVNGNPVYIRDAEGASVAGAGYYRVAANTAGGAGRGAFICTVYTTGGSYAPREVVIQGHADWSSTETIHTVKSSAANTYFTKARIVRESGDAFLEVYFYAAITDLEIETVAVGHAGWYSLSGTLTAATGTESRTGPVTLIAPGLNTQDVVNATQGFQVNNQTVIDNSRNIENITTITTEGTATSGTIMDIRPSDTNQMFRVRFPDSSTMEMGTTRAGAGAVQKAVVYGQAGVDINTNGVLRASMTQAGDFSLDADCGGLYFGGSTRSTSTNAQAYIKESGLNLDIKGNDNVRLLGDGGGVILHADYTGKVMIGNGATAPASILHVKGTQSYGSIRVSPTSANGESCIAFFTDTAGTATGSAWVAGHAGWGNTNDFVIGNQAFGGPVMLMQQDGKIGIGTTSPGDKLTIEGSGAQVLSIYSTDTGSQSTAKTFINLYGENTNGDKRLQGQIASAPGHNASNAGELHFSTNNSSSALARRMTIREDGNVGIGTASPSARLHIDQSGNTRNDGLFIERNGSTYGLNLYVNSGGYGVIGGNGGFTPDMIHLDFNQQDVGIGTSPVNQYKLEVYDGDYTQMMLRGPSYPTLRFKADNQNSGNNGTISVGANNSFNINPNNTTVGISIANDGKVGIGETSPNRRVVVKSADNVTNSIQFQSPTTGNAAGDGVGVGMDSARKAFLWNYEGNDIYLGGATSSTAMTILGSGNVGIGTSVAPANKLNIQVGTDTRVGFWGSSSYGAMQVTNDANSVLKTLRFDASGYNFVGGNVGIGQTAPATLLHVGKSDTAASVVTITHENSDGFGSLDIDSYGSATFRMLSNFSGSTVNGMANDTFSLMTPHTYPILFGTAGVERMRIQAAGNVGIGHTIPKSKLSIVGDGSLNTYSGTIGIENTASDKWASITLTDDIDTANASSNYYLIGRGSTYAQRYMSFHVPTAANYGSGSQPKFVFASTGGDELMTIEASTGNAYHKGTVGIGTSAPDAKLHVDGAAIIGGNQNKDTTPIAGLHVIDDTYSQWSGTLAPEQCALRVETYWNGSNSHPRAAGDYGGGIVFNHLGGHSASHGKNMHCWVGPRVWDTPGRERAGLVFATNDDTSTQPAAGVTTIEERMVITPYGNVGIANKNPGYLLEVGDASQTNSNIFSGRVNGDFIFNLSKASTNLFSIRNNGTGIVHLNTQNSAALGIGVSTVTGTGTLISDLLIDGSYVTVQNKMLRAAAGAGFKIGSTSGVYERFFNSSYGPNGTANLMYKLNLGNSGGLSGLLEITVQGTYSHQDVSGYVKRTTNIGLNQNGSIWRNSLQSIEHFGQAPSGIVIGPVQWDSSASQYYVNIYKVTSNGNAFTVGVKLTTASGTDGGFSTWTLSNHATLAAPTGYTSRYDTNARPQNINRQYITDTSSEAFRVAGNVHAGEFDLPSCWYA